MNNRTPEPASPITLTLTVSNQRQARELNDAWREIVTGKSLARAAVVEHDRTEIMERARVALATIEGAIRNNPTSGQAGRLIRFLAGLYNGNQFPFDLTDLRALDTDLSNACLDYLSYDRLGHVEVHKHLERGEREFHEWMRAAGLLAQDDK
jgi:hypothetical protein